MNHRPFRNDDEYFELILRDKGKSGDIYDKNNGQKYVIEIFFTDKEYARMKVSTTLYFDYVKEAFTFTSGQSINDLKDILGEDLIEKATGKSYKVEYAWTNDIVYITSIFTLPEAFDRFVFKDKSPFGILQD